MWWWQLIKIGVLSWVLLGVADLMVGAVNRLAKDVALNKFGLAAFLVATTTSLPELFVGIAAALEGDSVLSLGNVLGSNIANVSLVIGGAAILGGSVAVVGDFLTRDFVIAFLIGSLPLILLLNGSLSVWDGLVLVTIYFIYQLAELRKPGAMKCTGRWRGLLRKMGKKQTERDLLWLVLGIFLILILANLLVKEIVQLASTLKLSVFVGGLLLAMGTTLPELSFEIEAIRKREVGMVFGNLLGSVVTNSTLILGVVAIISPIKVTQGIQAYFLTTVVFVIVFCLFWLMAYSKKKLERWEGLVLLGIYALFIGWEVWTRS